MVDLILETGKKTRTDMKSNNWLNNSNNLVIQIEM